VNTRKNIDGILSRQVKPGLPCYHGFVELKTKRSDLVFRGRVFDIIVDRVEYPSGNEGVREVVRHPGGSAVVALLPERRVVLVEQLRWPLSRRILELPAGRLDPGEDPAETAARELAEETGWIAGKIQKLVAVYPTPGFCDELIHIYLATDLTPGTTRHTQEEGEQQLVVHEMALVEAVRRISTGEIQDGKTMIGLLLVQRMLANGVTR
jgi:ADP-ribose pyrophosphatase